MKTLYSFTILFLLVAFTACAQYVTVWKTDIIGQTAQNYIRIPASGSNYNIAWQEEGNPSNNGTAKGVGLTTIYFPKPGTYQVSITPGEGTFDRVNANNTPDRNRLIEVRQWGNIAWASMENAYNSCENLTITATDKPNLQNVTSMSEMFYGCSSLVNIPGIENWDVSKVTNMSGMFKSATKFNQPIGGWNVSNVTNMSSMFYQARAFNQPLANWNVANVTNMFAMFCLSTVFNQPVNDWNVGKVTSMSNMFYGASLFNQPLDRWNVRNVTDMTSMFAAASRFNQPLGHWRIYSVTTLATMLVSTAMDCASMTHTLQGWASNPRTPNNITFGATGRNYGTQAVAAKAKLQTINNWTMSIGVQITCSSPAEPYVTVWKTDNEGISETNQIIIPATGTNYNISWEMEGNATIKGTAIGNGNHTLTFPSPGTYIISITPGTGTFTRIAFANENDRNKILEVRHWGSTQWENMENAYQGCGNLIVTAIDVPDLQDVTSTSNMFNWCTSLSGVPAMNQWDMSTVNNMQSMFAYATHFNSTLNNWNVSNVTDMSALFQGAEAFNQPIDEWNVSKVTSMFTMFDNAKVFNQPIGSWDVHNVISMYGMFIQAINFNQPLDKWDVSQVIDMGVMFSAAELFDGAIGSWNVGNVTSMNRMFDGAAAFNQSLGSWDVSKVTDMSMMFNAAKNFNQPLDGWDVSNVTDMSSMFNGASNFNSAIGTWRVENVTNMSFMFSEASNFNQSLNSWDVSQVTDMMYMFFNAYHFNQPVNDWYVGQVTSMSSVFYNASAFNQSLDNWMLTSVTDMSYMLSFSGMDCANMALTLQGWAANPATPDNIVLGAEVVTYGLSAAEALASLRDTKNWTIDIGIGVICSALEVSLIHFDAKYVNGIVKIDWATASETDNDYFEIERSENALNWQVVNRIKGAGTVTSAQNYLVTDPDPLGGTSYYRLKYVDFSGIAGYSRIRAINNSGLAKHNIYPNPATTSITISGEPQGYLKMYNLAGLEVMQAEIKAEKQQISVGQLPAGTYIIKMDDGWNTKYIKR